MKTFLKTIKGQHMNPLKTVPVSGVENHENQWKLIGSPIVFDGPKLSNILKTNTFLDFLFIPQNDAKVDHNSNVF